MKLYAEVDDKDRKLKTLYGIVEYMDGTRLVCDKFYAVKEQEPILDKIKDEILNDWQIKKFPSSPFSCGLRYAVEIIDKYRGEEDGKID